MGALAATNLSAMTMTSMLNDLQVVLKNITDKRQYLTMKTMKLAEMKASIFQQSGLGEDKVAENQLAQLENIEKVLEAMDKNLEMNQKNVETQVQITTKRMEMMEKMRDKNIETGFKGVG